MRFERHKKKKLLTKVKHNNLIHFEKIDQFYEYSLITLSSDEQRIAFMNVFEQNSEGLFKHISNLEKLLNLIF